MTRDSRGASRNRYNNRHNKTSLGRCSWIADTFLLHAQGGLLRSLRIGIPAVMPWTARHSRC